MTDWYSQLTPLDFHYFAVSTNIFLYGYLTIMCIGFFGNLCQIVTFSRKTMRHVSTGVFFLAVSISDFIYLLLNFHIVIVYGLGHPDRSDLNHTCRLRHFFNYLTTTFSAWILTIISADRWIRTRFPVKAQHFCTPRAALITILVALLTDFSIHVQFVTPLFGPTGSVESGVCAGNSKFPAYVIFYQKYWPLLTTILVTVLPALMMIIFLLAIFLRIRSRQNRILPQSSTNENPREKRRNRFIHRQMFIMMLMTISLFFITTLPEALFRFLIGTIKIPLPYSLSLLLTAIFGMISMFNSALNFYLHCLTSRLYRKEFFAFCPCKISIQLKTSRNQQSHGTFSQQGLSQTKRNPMTQTVGRQNQTNSLELNVVGNF